MSIIDRFKEKITPKKPTAKDVPVLMMDGSVEVYPASFQITDGINCFVGTVGRTYHTNMDCKEVQFALNLGNQFTAMRVRDAERQGFSYCYECRKTDEVMSE